MKTPALDAQLLVVVGPGGVGKTTLSAALALDAARNGDDTLVMTFDPSRRLKNALGVGEEAAGEPVRVASDTPGRLDASLLDARATFDRLIARYAPDEPAAQRIVSNRFYHHLAGGLAGILEYMAVERLFEVAAEGRYRRVILDTPPTRQALEFLGAPERIVSFLDSGALQIALKPWFDASGRLRGGRLVGRGIGALLDRLIGLALLRDIAEFFQSFGPLYAGFKERAQAVQQLLRSERTNFALVTGPGAERVADALYFARRLDEAGCRLGAVIVNQVHPPVAIPQRGSRDTPAGLRLLAALGERDQRGALELAALMPSQHIVSVALSAEPPAGLEALETLGRGLARALAERGPGYRTAAS
ncbi:MAG: ArsA family ATPase [Gemmatimonadales bacterium]